MMETTIVLKVFLVVLIYAAVLGGGILLARFIDHRRRTATAGKQ